MIEVDKNLKTKTEIAASFNLPKSSLSTIIKDREKIYEALAEGNYTSKTKKIRTAKFEDLEEWLFAWVK